MSDHTSALRIEKSLAAIYTRGEPDPAFAAELRQKLIAEAERTGPQTSSDRRFFRPAWAIAFLVLLALAVSILWIGPGRVLAAVRGWVGFIPGMGFISDVESAQVLSTPVSQTGSNARLTVTDAVTDVETTRIHLEAEAVGVRCDASAEETNRLIKPNGLILPDGSQVSMKGWQWNCASDPNTVELVFDPLPAGATEAVLRFDVAPGAPSDLTVQTWELPLRFQPAPESPRVEPAATHESGSSAADGIRMVLESVAQTDAYTALRVRLEYSGEGQISMPDWGYRLEVTSPGGDPVGILDPPSFEAKNTVATIHIRKVDPGTTYMLRLNGPVEISLPIAEDDPSAQFTVDLGANPAIGDTHALDLPIQAGGYTLTARQLTLFPGEAGAVAVTTKFEASDPISGVMLLPVGDAPAVVQSSWGGAATPDGKIPLDTTIEFQQIPTGPLRLRIAYLFRPLGAQWQLEWSVP